MAKFDGVKELAFNNLVKTRSIVVNGTVSVSAWDGDSFIDVDTLTSGAYQYYTGGLRLRFTPNSGSTYTIQED